MEDQKISAAEVKIGVLNYIRKQIVKRKYVYEDMISYRTRQTKITIGGDIRGIVCIVENGICTDLLNQGVKYKLVDCSKSINSPLIGVDRTYDLKTLLVMTGFTEGTKEDLRRTLDNTIFNNKWLQENSMHFFGNKITKYGPLSIKVTNGLNFTILPRKMLDVVMMTNKNRRTVSNREKRLALKYNKLEDIN